MYLLMMLCRRASTKAGTLKEIFSCREDIERPQDDIRNALRIMLAVALEEEFEVCRKNIQKSDGVEY